MYIIKQIFFIALFSTLVSCGGGGGNSTTVSAPSISSLTSLMSSSAVSSSASLTSSISSSSVSSNASLASSISSSAITSSQSSANFLITTKSNLGGAVSPSSNIVAINSISDFLITPENGYKTTRVSGCEGTLKGSVFTTARILSDCTIEATFSLEVSDAPEAPRVIAYVVEQKANEALGDYLAQFAAIVASDTRSATKIILVASNAKPTDIRKSLQVIDNLWGVFLIGDVPASMRVISGGERIDDAYYRLLNCSQFEQIDDFNFTFPSLGSNVESDPECWHGNWVSRIIGRSSGRTDDVVAFIKKDIELRNSSRWIPSAEFQAMGWFGSVRKDYESSPWSFYIDLSFLFASHPLYNKNQITQLDVPGHTAQDMLHKFKNCLTSPLEICEVEAHGNGDGVQIEGQGEMGVEYSFDSIWLDSNAIASWPIRAKVISMMSCGPGDFSKDNFLAGNILHSGETLLVTTATKEMLVSSTYMARKSVTELPSLGMGESFAEVNPLGASFIHYFGDPTITLRSKPQGNQPIMVLNGKRYHSTNSVIPLTFPDSENNSLVTSPLSIGNAGTADLKIRLSWRPDKIGINKQSPCLGASSCAYSLAFNVKSNLPWVEPEYQMSSFASYDIITIAPGAQRTIDFSFEPMLVMTFPDGDLKKRYGSFVGSWLMISNDPESSRVWLELSAKAVP